MKRIRRPRVPRARIRVGSEHIYKTFLNAADAEREIQWYRRLPWATPRLIEVTGPTLTLERLPTALQKPALRPVRALWDLLEELHSQGVHHRDVHVKNIVLRGEQPLLIDWETAVHMPGHASYDLYGPDASGVPVPEIHADFTPQWWGSEQSMSIKKRWGACGEPQRAIPGQVAQRASDPTRPTGLR